MSCPPSGAIQLLRLDIGRADYLAPGIDLDLDARGEFRRRACDGIEAERGQAFLDVRRANDSNDRPLQQGDDVLRRPRWDEDADPAVTLDVRISGFGHGGHL